MLEFSANTRKKMSAELRKKTEPVSCFIIGGGIVGAGLARELAIRGIDCVLAEKSDFASGTSSRSSKLIHGGLRYLEMFDFGLVFESLSERHWLLKTHPHLVTPLEFNLPLYKKKESPPGARTSSVLGVGLWVYDALSLFRTPFFHGKHSKAEVETLFPKIRNHALQGSYYYADAMMLDDELVLETIYDAYRRGYCSENEKKVLPLHYLEVKDVRKKGQYFEVELKDHLEPGSAPFSIQAKEVVSCVGPWTETMGMHIQGGAERKLKPSKGVHLILDWKRLPVEKCLVMYAKDGRIVFVIPRKDLGHGAELVIVGTTDSAEHGEIDQIKANGKDTAYLLEVLAEYFPESKISEQDILMTFAGVRPLLDSGETSEAQTSREHEIWRNKAGVVFMAGGKYTTFRKISQEIADFVFPKTGSKKFNQESKSLLSSHNEYAERLSGNPVWGKFTDHWVDWKLKHHSPCHLEDLIFRRMPLWMAGVQKTESILPLLAEKMGAYLGWSSDQIEAESQIVLQKLRSWVSFS